MGRTLLFVAVALGALLVPAAAAAAPTGYVVYENDEVQLGTVDLGAGSPSVTNIGSTGINSAGVSFTGLGLAPSGAVYAVESDAGKLYALDATTGAVLDSVTLDAGVANSQVAVTHDGRVFVLDGNALREVDPDTGVTTLRATLPNGSSGLAVRCVDAAGTSQLFALGGVANRLYRIDLPSFTVTTLPQPLGVPLNAAKIAFDAAGTLWGLNVNVVNPSTFTLDPETGAGTTVGSSGAPGAYGLGITASSCPPPQPVEPVEPTEPTEPVVAAPVELTPAFTG